MAKSRKSLGDNPLSRFREYNKIKVEELRSYLGITNGRLYKMLSGASEVPDDIMYRLLVNDKGWKRDMLTTESNAADIIDRMASVVHLPEKKRRKKDKPKDLTSFAEFKKLNGLRLKEIQDYLGLSHEYVSRMSCGMRPMTDDIRARLIANDRGWDITPLVDDKEASEMNLKSAVLNAKLAEENKELRARVLTLEKDKANYWGLIEKLLANLKTE